jgi:hypothetical protein
MSPTAADAITLTKGRVIPSHNGKSRIDDVPDFDGHGNTPDLHELNEFPSRHGRCADI